MNTISIVISVVVIGLVASYLIYQNNKKGKSVRENDQLALLKSVSSK